MKWAMELSEFNVVFKAKTSIKGWALADSVVEYTPILVIEEEMELVESPRGNRCHLPVTYILTKYLMMSWEGVN